jgi:hypothetical protein
MTKSEYHVGTSVNIDQNVHLTDVLSGAFLNDEKSIGKYYEITQINDLELVRLDGGGRCTYCHAGIDKTCGIKVVTCLNSTHECYRRKYII